MGIFKTFFRWLIVSPLEATTPSVNQWELQRQVDKDEDRMMQQVEDERVGRFIHSAARDMFLQYERATTITIGGNSFKNVGIIIMPPLGFYIIHDEDTAKFKTANIEDLIKKEYSRLRSGVEDYSI